jgi:SAM-dependent methyltransferase
MVKDGNKRYHDRVAARYDDIYDSPYWRFYRDLSWRHLRGFLPRARPAWAADLGCGTGWFAARLRKSGLHVVCLDPSGRMLEQCRANLERDARAGQVRCVQAGLEDMRELADASLDFATAQGDPLSFCEAPAKALRELARVCRPGAHVVLSVDNRAAGVRALCERPTADEALALLRTGRTRWRGREASERFPIKMFEPDELTGLLAHAGFETLSLIGKTCLVQRANEGWLAEPRARRALLRAEERVHRSPHWLALASHLQIAARRR